MTSREEALESHTIVIHHGRILDVLPSALAAERYAPAAVVERPDHVLLPGLVNAQTHLAPGVRAEPERLHDGALLAIAEMLKAGTTCFCAMGDFPEESARAAAEQGMRAVIGIPIAESPGPWAGSPGAYLTRALDFRDEYRGHPSIATVFAPHAPSAISDSTFGRIATLADELDAGILLVLHESPDAIAECVTRHGVRPIERMHALGLLTPALTAVHMVHVDAADIALAQRSGVAIALCPQSNLRNGWGPPPVAAWVGSGLRLSVGSGPDESGVGLDVWSELRLLSLLSHSSVSGSGSLNAWDSLAIATRGGAAALGLDAEIGTLEPGKWADLCCVDMRGPALLNASLGASRRQLAAPLVFNATRDAVSDVWVAGRHLVADGAFTRLDWPELSRRVGAWPARPTFGE